MTGRLNGSAAIVTGGAKGIGRITVEMFLAEGARVCAFDIEAPDSASVTELRAAVADCGDRFVYSRVDVTSEADVGRGVEAAIASLGGIDILVNNAGKGPDPTPVENLSLVDWDAALRLNLTSAFLCARAVIPHMKQRRSGRIINLASQAGRSKSEVSNLPYASAKAGVLGFTRNLAHEVGSFGITVNAVAPGVTLTERIADKLARRADREALTDAIPLRRFGDARDVAGAILFLASSDAAYVTGATIDVNGGRTMM
ncbi:SDR family NAD(P)-dependent oxidoreductase [Methylobacterium brachythecii]|uniref:D-threitol dehydrogenase n=1 Tax=Methylobacterium brachythecii TaxID=1176177 RepID=A0A7W6ALJ5_9HYPH|nr:SDR family NAD(P)-dependent oxidoreductase [Methylobacterium brachythecii]MBB3904826.1 NAD(P)-dependent dehydrogenase (short-subunit alcohol dehydrogenase family) [Methylobacterium brachythecii]GLS45378.1 D-threitol dehydrogenase [Methylobacterium brachythecii]